METQTKPDQREALGGASHMGCGLRKVMRCVIVRRSTKWVIRVFSSLNSGMARARLVYSGVEKLEPYCRIHLVSFHGQSGKCPDVKVFHAGKKLGEVSADMDQ